MIKAVLWDVDGTLAETELDGHLKAFNRAFEAMGIPWRWSDERYAQLLHIAGGRERLSYDMQCRDGARVDPRRREELADGLHRLKNDLYADIVAAGGLQLREGVAELLQDCTRADVRLGLVTTTSRANVEALLRVHLGRDWESVFAAVICAREAPRKKPHPQAYRLALDALRLHPHEAVAMEDAPAGIAAAQAAGVPVIVTRSYFFAEVECRDALAVGPSLGRIPGWDPMAEARGTRIDLEQIFRWYAQSRWAPLQ
jgi:HAD superfamily hydrolase (TIGR01509 family)